MFTLMAKQTKVAKRIAGDGSNVAETNAVRYSDMDIWSGDVITTKTALERIDTFKDGEIASTEIERTMLM